MNSTMQIFALYIAGVAKDILGRGGETRGG